jgi:hypothetical protein
MSASDLPELRHPSSLAMARVLVTYMDDPAAIRRAIRAEFDQPPAERTIEHLRAAHLASLAMPEEEPFKPHEGYHPAGTEKAAAKASAIFLARIMAERSDSTFRNSPQGEQRKALDSTYLTRPELVDKAWERACR